MKCQHIFKNGNNCKNNTIGDMDRCYIISHQTNMIIYQKTLQRLKNEFISSTIDIKNFIVEDVPMDGACVFHCMVLSIIDYSRKYKIMVNHDSEYVDDFFEKIYCEETVDDEMAYLIQQIIREWIMENQEREVEGLSLRDYICMCHELDSIEEYNNRYKRFAGEEDYIRTVSERVVKKVNIGDRWGGSPEFYAFTKIFGLELHIYTLKKFSEKTGKILNGSTKNDVSRLKHIQTFNGNGLYSTRFLLTESKRGNHFSYLRIR